MKWFIPSKCILLFSFCCSLNAASEPRDWSVAERLAHLEKPASDSSYWNPHFRSKRYVQALVCACASNGKGKIPACFLLIQALNYQLESAGDLEYYVPSLVVGSQEKGSALCGDDYPKGWSDTNYRIFRGFEKAINAELITEEEYRALPFDIGFHYLRLKGIPCRENVGLEVVVESDKLSIEDIAKHYIHMESGGEGEIPYLHVDSSTYWEVHKESFKNQLPDIVALINKRAEVANVNLGAWVKRICYEPSNLF